MELLYKFSAIKYAIKRDLKHSFIRLRDIVQQLETTMRFENSDLIDIFYGDSKKIGIHMEFIDGFETILIPDSDNTEYFLIQIIDFLLKRHVQIMNCIHHNTNYFISIYEEQSDILFKNVPMAYATVVDTQKFGSLIRSFNEIISKINKLQEDLFDYKSRIRGIISKEGITTNIGGVYHTENISDIIPYTLTYRVYKNRRLYGDEWLNITCEDGKIICPFNNINQVQLFGIIYIIDMIYRYLTCDSSFEFEINEENRKYTGYINIVHYSIQDITLDYFIYLSKHVDEEFEYIPDFASKLKLQLQATAEHK